MNVFWIPWDAAVRRLAIGLRASDRNAIPATALAGAGQENGSLQKR